MAVNEMRELDSGPDNREKDNTLFAGRVITQIITIVDFVRALMNKDEER